MSLSSPGQVMGRLEELRMDFALRRKRYEGICNEMTARIRTLPPPPCPASWGGIGIRPAGVSGFPHSHAPAYSKGSLCV
jgi:hypothetical protein